MTHYVRQPGQAPVPQLWVCGSPSGAQLGNVPRPGPVRIGDAERDSAVAALGDHFAAGRLSREEFDERMNLAMQARFDHDLQPLFVDLPGPAVRDQRPAAWPEGMRPVVPPLLWLAPILLVAVVVTAIALGAPWMLWGFFWVFVLSRVWLRRRFSPPRHWHHR